MPYLTLAEVRGSLKSLLEGQDQPLRSVRFKLPLAVQ
jgi:hypothetical protein